MPGPNKLSWHHLKIIVNNSVCLSKIINIAIICFDISFWPSIISQTLKHVQDMFNFNITLNPCGYWVLFVSKTPPVV